MQSTLRHTQIGKSPPRYRQGLQGPKASPEPRSNETALQAPPSIRYYHPGWLRMRPRYRTVVTIIYYCTFYTFVMAALLGKNAYTADPQENPTPKLPKPLKLLSLNCRGLMQTNRRLLLFNILCKLFFDIIFLQETKAPAKNNWSQEWLNTSGGRSYFPKAKSNNSAGFAVLFNQNFLYKEHGIMADPNGHILSMSISQDNFHY